MKSFGKKLAFLLAVEFVWYCAMMTVYCLTGAY